MSGWGGMWLGPLLMWGVPVLLIVLIAWLVRGSTGSPPSSDSKSDGRSILDERFATGEFDEEDYQKRRNSLNVRKSG